MKALKVPCQAPRLGGTCKAPLYWLKSVSTGKPAPIDAEPSETGNIAIHLEDGTYEIVKGTEALETHRAAKVPLHTNHFGTCVDAELFRRKKSA